MSLISLLSCKLAEDGKGLVTTVVGMITGYGVKDATQIESINTILQHTVWTFTIIISVFTIVGWLQKQRDRKKEGKSSIFNLFRTRH